MIRTISRNRRKRIDDIFSGATACVLCLADPWGSTDARSCVPQHARAEFWRQRSACLRDKGSGRYTITVQAHVWYEIASTVKEPQL